jgi:hypothetical protein
MMGLMRLLLRPWASLLNEVEEAPLVADPEPNAEYRKAMAQATAAQARAERVIASTMEVKQTRPV